MTLAELALAGRLARRELRGALPSFRVFLLCLALGVAAIAAVGTVKESIERGFREEAAVILGGDAEVSFTYRYAEDAERTFMSEIATNVSETVDFRSMALVDGPEGSERGLTQVRAVDGLWPLYGEAGLEPAIPLADAFDPPGDLPGGIMDPILAERLGVEVGDTFRLGRQEFVMTALLTHEPDGVSSGFSLGPRTVVLLEDLSEAELLGPGTLFDTAYRLALPQGADIERLEREANAQFETTGLRWRDSRDPAPGVQVFVDRIGSFLVLVGLAGLAVGGVGIAASVRAYLEGKVNTIATLRSLGAETRVIFALYLLQIAVLSVIGVVLGLALGALLPIVFQPLIEARLPVPIVFGFYPAALGQAALYGVLTAFAFALWPLARTGDVRAAALYRDGAAGKFRLPGAAYLAAMAALAAALIGASVWLSGIPRLALYTAGGILVALLILALAALALRALARRLARAKRFRGNTTVRLALAAIGGPRSDAVPVILSLGLGLSVLATVGQIDTNLRAAIERDLPDVAPSYFFVDIQNDQLGGFVQSMQADDEVSRVETAPMLRGILTQINGVSAREVAGDHWVIEGDRGITYLTEAPPPEEVVEGEWWPDDYAGPPLVAFAAEEAREIGLGLGDTITVNVLGRDIVAEIAALREVDFSNAGIGFILTFSQNALAGAPHTHIATVYAEPEAEARILRAVTEDAPNITAIRVRDAIDRVADALTGLAAATSLGASATLLTGFVVLIGAAAAGERARVFEAALLKTLGAVRRSILWSFALRAGMLGAAAGAVAVFAGALGGWAVLTFVMESSYRFEPISAALIIVGGALATLLAGLAFALRPLAARPARILRAQD
ncbi:MAG: FtsX-like permease family protein [Pseudomonadota bacterium]